jgi:hypothetical protein
MSYDIYNSLDELIGKECYLDESEDLYEYSGKFKIIGFQINHEDGTGSLSVIASITPIENHNLTSDDLFDFTDGVPINEISMI